MWAEIPGVCVFCVKYHTSVQTARTPMGQSRPCKGALAHSSPWKNKLSYHKTPVIPPLSLSACLSFCFFSLPPCLLLFRVHSSSCFLFFFCSPFLWSKVSHGVVVYHVPHNVNISGDSLCKRKKKKKHNIVYFLPPRVTSFCFQVHGSDYYHQIISAPFIFNPSFIAVAPSWVWFTHTQGWG